MGAGLLAPYFGRKENMMIIRLFKCTAENNRVDKTNFISNAFNMMGALKDKSSVIDPVIIIEKTNPALYNYNYMYIEDFGRWYYINNIVAVTNKLWEIHAHVDVLYTWGADIRKAKCIIDKTSSLGNANLYLDDGSFVMDSHKYNTVIPFPSGLSETGKYILICAGG